MYYKWFKIGGNVFRVDVSFEVFGMTSEQSLLDKFDATDGKVVLLKKFDDRRNELKGNLSNHYIKEDLSLRI